MANSLFIGGGNMTQALLSGIYKNPAFSKSHQITVIDRNLNKCEAINQLFNIQTLQSIPKSTPKDKNFFNQFDQIILAIKPQAAEKICKELSNLLKLKSNNITIISILAGINIKKLHQWLSNPSQPIIRAMPNTPSDIQAGAMGVFANQYVTEKNKLNFEAIFKNTGLLGWVKDENLIDVITALSGSGPAYIFYLIECLATTAESMGLDKNLALDFAKQTVFGAGKMAKLSLEDPSVLRDKVTSKGGTTAAGLSVLKAELPRVIQQTMEAAFKRARELGS